MRHRWSLAVLLGLGLAGPAAAQQAPAPAAVPQAPRPVAPRDLMTPQERSAFRAQMEQASIEQRRLLWAQKHQELAQRATARGQTMAEPVHGLGAADGALRREPDAPRPPERPTRWTFWGMVRR